MLRRMMRFVACMAMAGALLAACDGDRVIAEEQAPSDSAHQVIRFGVCPGPYGRMIEEALAPILASQNMSLEIVVYSDYLQPDIALDSGEIDANLMQHQAYLDEIIKTHKFKLVSVINVPTLGMGVFSRRYQTFDELRSGERIAVPRDHTNQARALRLARDLGLITLRPERDEHALFISDIEGNAHKADFIAVDAQELVDRLEDCAFAFVPGNYAVAAGLQFSKALGVEKIEEDMKNVIAVRHSDQATLGRILKDAVSSPAFRQVIDEDVFYSGFTRPQWWH